MRKGAPAMRHEQLVTPANVVAYIFSPKVGGGKKFASLVVNCTGDKNIFGAVFLAVVVKIDEGIRGDCSSLSKGRRH